MGWECGMHERGENAHNILIWKNERRKERKKTLGDSGIMFSSYVQIVNLFFGLSLHLTNSAVCLSKKKNQSRRDTVINLCMFSCEVSVPIVKKFYKNLKYEILRKFVPNMNFQENSSPIWNFKKLLSGSHAVIRGLTNWKYSSYYGANSRFS